MLVQNTIFRRRDVNYMKITVEPFFFKTQNNNIYTYDNSTRVIIPINDVEKEFLESAYKKSLDLSDFFENSKFKNIVLKIDTLKLFNKVNNSLEFDEKQVDEVIHQGASSIVLILTEQCNLRCKYCCYSDNYYYMQGYSNNSMDIDTALKGVDFYLKNNINNMKYNPNIKFAIVFYGGEPLLKWDIIKNVVNHIEKNYQEYWEQIIFSITTNGTLLNEENVTFMIRNGFNVNVSIDGYKENHDRNRVNFHNKPTFDTIIKNLEIYEKYYLEYKEIHSKAQDYKIFITYDNLTDLEYMESYFRSNPIFDSKISLINKVETNNTNYYANQNSEEFLEKRIKMRENLFLKYRQDLANGKTTNFLSVYFSSIFTCLQNYCNFTQNTMRGNCIPGSYKYVLNYDNKWVLCEKISSSYIIGDLEKGFSRDQQLGYLEKFRKLSDSHCENCNIKNICSFCFANIQYKNNDFKIPKEFCENSKRNVEQILSEYYTLIEDNLITK